MKEEIWIIRDKKTKETWMTSSGKFFWKKQAHAKSAWANNYDSVKFHKNHKEVFDALSGLRDVQPIKGKTHFTNRYRVPYFDEQDSYELVNVVSQSSVSKELFDECLDMLRIAYAYDLEMHDEARKDVEAFLERFD